jgi:hypothetical protein
MGESLSRISCPFVAFVFQLLSQLPPKRPDQQRTKQMLRLALGFPLLRARSFMRWVWKCLRPNRLWQNFDDRRPNLVTFIEHFLQQR